MSIIVGDHLILPAGIFVRNVIGSSDDIPINRYSYTGDGADIGFKFSHSSTSQSLI